jgi:hypothetical protein
MDLYYDFAITSFLLSMWLSPRPVHSVLLSYLIVTFFHYGKGALIVCFTADFPFIGVVIIAISYAWLGTYFILTFRCNNLIPLMSKDDRKAYDESTLAYTLPYHQMEFVTAMLSLGIGIPLFARNYIYVTREGGDNDENNSTLFRIILVINVILYRLAKRFYDKTLLCFISNKGKALLPSDENAEIYTSIKKELGDTIFMIFTTGIFFTWLFYEVKSVIQSTNEVPEARDFLTVGVLTTFPVVFSVFARILSYCLYIDQKTIIKEKK